MNNTHTQPIRLTTQDGQALLCLSDVVDIFVVKDLYEAARTLLDHGEDTLVQWNTVENIDVTTIQVLFALQKGLQAQGRLLRFAPCSSSVRKTLVVSGLIGVFGETVQ